MVLREQKDRLEAQSYVEETLQADGVSYQAYYSEHGKAVYRGKDLAEVRSPQRKLMPDNVGLEKHEQTSLWGIAIKAKSCKTHRFQDLFRLLDSSLLWDSWHALNKNAASGVDKVTSEIYQENLESNIESLAQMLKTKTYRAKLVRRCYIPKPNGKERPLGIPALEDKLVQIACAKILNSIFEADFLDNSYGYRPNRSAKDAIQDLRYNLAHGSFGYVVEADIKGFFDNIDHDWLLKMLMQRIDDKAFLHLIGKWLKAGILDADGKVIDANTGTPQGGIVSPILANVYLHFVLNLWFYRVVKRHCTGQAMLVVYADDFVCAFQYKKDATRFYQALPKRLLKFNLEVAPEKTQLMRFSRFRPNMQKRIEFLGFEIYWFYDRRGEPCVMQRTARKKLQGACSRIKEWIRENRHLKGRQFITALNRRLQGHYNYYDLRGNSPSLWRFYNWAVKCSFKCLNRRGGKRNSFTWGSFTKAIKRLGIASPIMKPSNRQHIVLA